MATNNRAHLINQVLKVVKKHFKPFAVPKDRNLLENLLFACCLENSAFESADKVFRTLVADYFDWNEVRVSTIRELAEVMRPLNDPEDSATRLKRILQSVFETHYSFDLELLRKQNIGQSVKQLAAYNGCTPFAVAFVTQQALGGHAIPTSRGLLQCMRVVGAVTEAEAAKGAVPGLDRAIPKNKGAELGSLLHQLGVEMSRSPLGPLVRKLLLEINPDCKEQLPKRQPTKPLEAAAAAPPAAAAAAASPASAAASDARKKPERPAAATPPTAAEGPSATARPKPPAKPAAPPKAAEKPRPAEPARKPEPARKAEKTVEKTVDKKAAEKRPAEKKPAPGEKKAVEKKTLGKKPADKKAPEKKAAEKKPADKKAPEKKVAESKVAEKKVPAAKAADKKAPDKKSPAASKAAAAKKAPPKKAPPVKPITRRKPR